MAVYAVETINVDLGERFHVRGTVAPKCGADVPFTIHAAKYELVCPDKTLEDSGEAEIIGHDLSALVQPEKEGTYLFKFIYEIADEIWIDVKKLKVG